MKKLLLLTALMIQMLTQAQTTIFSEDFGTPTGTTTIVNYLNGTAPATFQNKSTHFYAGTADIRNTSPSSTYSGASGGGNLWITNSANRDFVISNINTSNYTNISLTLGYLHGSNTAGQNLIIEYSTDSINWTAVSYSRPTSTSWNLLTTTTNLVASSNFKIRLRQPATGSFTTFRIDDIKITGIANTPCAISPVLVKSIIKNACPFVAVTKDSFVATNKPDSNILTFHSADTAKQNNLISGNNLPSGTYYISFFDTAKQCFSTTKTIQVDSVDCSILNIYTENFGNPTANTDFNSYHQGTLPNRYEQPTPPITYAGIGTVRTSSPSNIYDNASGLGNAFITNNDSTHLFISGINTSSYTDLTFSFGENKNTTNPNAKLKIEVSPDGINFWTLNYQNTNTNTANWNYVSCSGYIPQTNNLRIRILNPLALNQFRIDDLKLSGRVDTASPCTKKPILSSYSLMQDKIQCPSAVIDLNSIIAYNASGGKKLRWHTSFNITPNNRVFTQYAPAGVKYYATIFDSINNCNSPLDSIITRYESCNTTCFFNENMDTTSSTKLITAHAFQNQNNALFSGSADVRSTTPSNTYLNASGNANVFFTSTTNTDFKIENIKTHLYDTIYIKFGVLKSASSANLNIEAKTQNGSWQTLNYLAKDTLSWTFATVNEAIFPDSFLSIRFFNTSSSTSFRIDDIQLCGTLKPVCLIKPILNDTIIVNVCPDTTIELSSSVSSNNMPQGNIVSFHNATPANPNNKLTNTIVAQSGNYYVSFFDSVNNCYGPTQKVAFNKTQCATTICQVKPILIDTIISNTCPDTTVNVENVILEQNKPTNAKLTWHNNSNATPNSKFTSLILSQAGDYFVSYFDSANNCYGPTQKVIFDKTTCSNTCVNKPNITDTILYNICPDTTINTNVVIVNGVNFGQEVTWHNSPVADATSEIQKPSIVLQNITYYIAIKETLNNCYTPTQKVQFIINKQVGANSLVLDTAICSSSSLTFNGRTYSQKGTYIDTIIKNGGCDSFVRIRISHLDSLKTPNLGQSIISNICPDTTINLNQKVTLLNNSVGAILQWHDTTKATPNNRYFDSIVYSSRLLYAFFKDTNNGCYSNPRMLMINIKNCDTTLCDTSKIIVSFSYANNILSANVAGAALPISYLWNNNNVTKTITVNNSGTYCVTIVDKNGCIKSACTTIQVLPPVNITCNLTANFVWNTQSNGSIQFMDSSTATGNGMTYLWSFGDGTFSQLKNPIKNYNASGTYTVTLLVYSWSSSQNQICADTVQKQITITNNNNNPCSQINPNFIWTQNGNVYNFVNTTDTTGISIISTQWQFSDGTTINFANPSRSLTIAGNYSVVLRLVVKHNATNQVCTLQIAKIINVLNNSNVCANLKARFSHTKQNNVVSFVNQSTGIVGSPQYLYIISNGDSIKTANGQYTFTKSGMYRITFKVRQNIGNTICTDSTSRLIQIFLSNNCKDSLYQDTFTKCNTFVSPVCGCDSITYANSCLAFKAGVKISRQGVCANDPNYVKICGYVVNDTNRNCQKDSTDAGIRNIRVRINSGNTSRVAITNAFGYYETWMPKGTFIITQELVVNNTILNPGVFQRCNLAPISLNANQGGQTYCGNNFYDSLSGCRDLKVALNRYTTTTPGFSQNNIISYQNNSPNSIQNVVLKYKMTTNTTLTFASPTYTVSSNIISWNLGTLAPFASGSKTVKSLVPVNYGLGIVSIDSAWIEPYTSDCNIANNKAVKVDTSVGSYDPNDKTAFPGGNIDTSVKSLTYLIRFQNTGTAPARNVIVEDVISNNIDFNSIRLKSLSHEGQMLIEENRKLIFEFPNIMLPDSASDPEGSIGYITFTANLKDGISVGDEINNFADIYFDFNDPIRTNTAKNIVVLGSESSISDIEKGYEIRFYPNPMTQGEANILMALQNSAHVEFSLFDIQGRLKWNYEKRRSGSQFLIPVQWYDLPKGIYLLEVKINGTSKEIIRIER